MRYFSLTLIALVTILMVNPTPADALSVQIGKGGVSVGHGWGDRHYGGYYGPHYVQPSCYYDYWGRLVCPRRYWQTPPVIVYPHKKKWKRHKRHHRHR